MPSLYPDQFDHIAADKGNATVTENDHPAHHNQLADAINAIQQALGLNLQQVFKVGNRFSEIAENEAAKVQARQNLGIQNIDGGTFN